MFMFCERWTNMNVSIALDIFAQQYYKCFFCIEGSVAKSQGSQELYSVNVLWLMQRTRNILIKGEGLREWSFSLADTDELNRGSLAGTALRACGGRSDSLQEHQGESSVGRRGNQDRGGKGNWRHISNVTYHSQRCNNTGRCTRQAAATVLLLRCQFTCMHFFIANTSSLVTVGWSRMQSNVWDFWGNATALMMTDYHKTTMYFPVIQVNNVCRI